jgi:hypothetical protein
MQVAKLKQTCIFQIQLFSIWIQCAKIKDYRKNYAKSLEREIETFTVAKHSLIVFYTLHNKIQQCKYKWTMNAKF